MLDLLRATSENDYFRLLKAEWDSKIRGYGADPSEFALPFIEHAERIAAERPVPKNYGIFVLRDTSQRFHGLFHANVAELPRTTGKTLRVLWFLASPAYEYEEQFEDRLAILASSLLLKSMELCKSQF